MPTAPLTRSQSNKEGRVRNHHRALSLSLQLSINLTLGAHFSQSLQESCKNVFRIGIPT